MSDVIRDLAVSRVARRKPSVVALDDTLARHTGKRIASASMHRDALLSTGAKPFFHFGHIWVVMTVIVSVPRWKKAFALPIGMRLYRSEKLCKVRELDFYKKPELASQMLSSLAKAIRTGESTPWQTVITPIVLSSNRFAKMWILSVVHVWTLRFTHRPKHGNQGRWAGRESKMTACPRPRVEGMEARDG